ncbi:hypothetical protein [uncultured Gimesia sp.]|mgnify:CR=1 FL=1|uniref:hypothetical protein n=1 Tax=uncultured Gimesia sp. TaxID=1678688 RepID=UPI002604C5B5|nr:hypothetical protein [uncultured Gimesia sp.]
MRQLLESFLSNKRSKIMLRPDLIKLNCLMIFFSLTANSVSNATIIEFQSLKIDLTNSEDTAAKARWFPVDKLTINDKGLGWDGSADSSRDGWIQTKPMAVGLSWRTAASISLQVTLDPAPTEITLQNGLKFTPDTGTVFARYSPDLKHWSSWQELQRTKPSQDLTRKKRGRNFSGRLTVPRRQRSSYGTLLSKYSELDVPWRSDEEAAVRWILNQQPEFFSENLPFIGYVEFLFEGGFYGNQRLRTFKADVSYALSGLHTIPRDREAYKNRFSLRWRLKAKGIKVDRIKPQDK